MRAGELPGKIREQPPAAVICRREAKCCREIYERRFLFIEAAAEIALPEEILRDQLLERVEIFFRAISARRARNTASEGSSGSFGIVTATGE